MQYLVLMLLIISKSYASDIKNFSTSKKWIRAGHWWKTPTGNYSSTIQDHNFFTSPEGAYSPELELTSFLKKIKSNPYITCQFPFRASLVKHLIDAHFPSCPQLESWKKRLNTEKISVFFAGPYSGDISSILGHTFLRLIPRKSIKSLPLHDPIVNFMAKMPKQDTIFQKIYSGIFRGYVGKYQFRRLGRRVFIYGYKEKRILYEYHLNLTAYQIDNLLNHIWELEGSSNFQYGFFAGNCTSYMMSALEGVLPQLQQSLWSFIYETPLEGIHRLKESQLIKNIVVWPQLTGDFTKEWDHAFSNHERTKNKQIAFLEKDPDGIKLLQFLNKRNTTKVLGPHQWPLYKRVTLKFSSQGKTSLDLDPFFQDFGPEFKNIALSKARILSFQLEENDFNLIFLELLKVNDPGKLSWSLYVDKNSYNAGVGQGLLFDKSALLAAFYADNKKNIYSEFSLWWQSSMYKFEQSIKIEPHGISGKSKFSMLYNQNLHLLITSIYSKRKNLAQIGSSYAF